MKKTNGLLALLGLGAYAYYKYTKMSPEEKGKVKGKIDNVKKNIEGYAEDFKSSVNKKLESAKHSANDLMNEAEDMYK